MINERILITNALGKVALSLRNKEMKLRVRFYVRERKLRHRILIWKEKLSAATEEIRYLRRENKRLRRAVHYLETVNGVTEKQTAKVDRILGLPKHIERADDWHKVAGDNWRYS